MDTIKKMTSQNIVETMVAMRWNWFAQWAAMLQKVPRDTGLTGLTNNFDITHSFSPSGRFVAYVSPKLQGIRNATRLVIRDLMEARRDIPKML
jgi:hypothetical protein